MKKLILLFLLPIVSYGASIVNGDFETGDLTGWTFTGENQNSFNSRVEGGEFAAATAWANQFGFFAPENMEGNYSFFSGFDGPVQEITLSQNIGVIDQFTTAVSFDVRAGWDLETYSSQSVDVINNNGVVLDREIRVVVTDNTTQQTLLSESLFNAVGGEKVLDSGLQTVGINFQNIVGSDVTMSFVQNIPQGYTGPALIQLDNIQLQQTFVPEPRSYGLIVGIIALSLIAIRRK